jgi:hypothetical protein
MYPPLLQPISTVSDSVAPPFPVLPANDCVGANRQATAAAEMQVSRSHYTLAGGRSGTTDLSPAQIVEKAEAAGERGHTTQVPAPIEPISTVSDSVAQTFLLLRAHDFVGGNHTTAAAVLGV